MKLKSLEGRRTLRIVGLRLLLVAVFVGLLANASLGSAAAPKDVAVDDIRKPKCSNGEKLVCSGKKVDDLQECHCKSVKKKKDPEPFFDCGKNPFKWNPIEGAFERHYIKWCASWTPFGGSELEEEYHGKTCDKVACAMGVTPAEFCDFSAAPAGPPPEMLVCSEKES